MRRLAALSTMIAGIAGVGLFHAAQARAAGGCSVASAPTIASGTTQSANENDCPGPDHYEYWALNLRIGDTLTVNATGTGLIGTGVDVYGPDVGTIDKPRLGAFRRTHWRRSRLLDRPSSTVGVGGGPGRRLGGGRIGGDVP